VSPGDHGNAVESFQHLLTIQPRNALALVKLGKSLFELGQVDPVIDAFRKSIDHLPPEMHVVPLGSIAVAIPGSSTANNQDVLDARRAWATRYLLLATANRIFPGRTADPNRSLRVGYVWAYFANRNWMKPVWGLIDHRDHDSFLIHVFSAGP
jgi:tetratricopeptide (TPR) repeat protein